MTEAELLAGLTIVVDDIGFSSGAGHAFDAARRAYPGTTWIGTYRDSSNVGPLDAAAAQVDLSQADLIVPVDELTPAQRRYGPALVDAVCGYLSEGASLLPVDDLADEGAAGED